MTVETMALLQNRLGFEAAGIWSRDVLGQDLTRQSAFGNITKIKIYREDLATNKQE
jgi:hypothetical protein